MSLGYSINMVAGSHRGVGGDWSTEEKHPFRF